MNINIWISPAIYQQTTGGLAIILPYDTFLNMIYDINTTLHFFILMDFRCYPLCNQTLNKRFIPLCSLVYNTLDQTCKLTCKLLPQQFGKNICYNGKFSFWHKMQIFRDLILVLFINKLFWG